MGDDFYFKARFSWSKSFEQLDDQELASLTRAIWLMGEFRENSAPTGKAAVVWPLIRADIEHDLRDRDNGRKGGRPPKDKNHGLNPGSNGGFNPSFTENSTQKTEQSKPDHSHEEGNQWNEKSEESKAKKRDLDPVRWFG